MKLRTCCLSLLLLAPAARQPVPLPPRGPSPLLFVRFTGSPGLHRLLSRAARGDRGSAPPSLPACVPATCTGSNSITCPATRA